MLTLAYLKKHSKFIHSEYITNKTLITNATTPQVKQALPSINTPDETRLKHRISKMQSLLQTCQMRANGLLEQDSSTT